LEEFLMGFSVQLLGLIYKRNIIVDFLELQKLNKKSFLKTKIMFKNKEGKVWGQKRNCYFS